MNSVEQLELWRSIPSTGDEMPEPIDEVKNENARAYRLVQQINQLAEFGRDTDVENE